ncbi:MAG: hypothetical protein M3Y65_11275 [Pseudomonadota bacterium]|nr:hypothetical protein [Pseudomonadota bacterium]
MTTATLNTAPQNTLRQQFANLRRALGEFSRALYAAQAREFTVADPVIPVTLSSRARQRALEELFALANTSQQHSPSLSTELHFIASRG